MIFVLVALVAMAGGLIHSVTGFGSGVIMMLFLPYFVDMVTAPALSSAISVGVFIMLSWNFRKYIDWKISVIPTVSYLACSLPIISLVKGLNLDMLSLVFGFFLIVLSVYFFVFAKNMKVVPNWKTAVVCGSLSGVTSGFFGIGGPLLAIYFVSATDSKEAYIGNLQFLFAVTNVVNLIMRISKGIYTVDLIPLTIVGFVGINLGKRMGLKILDRMNIDVMRKCIYAFVGVSGIIKVAQELAAML